MPAASKSSVAGWDDFIESLRSLPNRMLAKLPEEKRVPPAPLEMYGLRTTRIQLYREL